MSKNCSRPKKNDAVGKKVASCPAIKLVEFVEVIPHDKETPTQAPAGRKQFVNFPKNFRPGDSDHPEFGPCIRLRARLEWDPNTNTQPGLSGKKIYFYAKAGGNTGDKLPNAAAKDHYKDLAGFTGASGDKLKKEVTVADDGWSPVIEFSPGVYGGDKYDIYATENPAYTGGKKAGTYEVSRKFWLQFSYLKIMGKDAVPDAYKAFKPADLNGTKAAYAKVKVQVEDGTHNVYDADPNPLASARKAKPFYPRWMINTKSQTDDLVPVIGDHNKTAMADATWKEEADKPLKMNVLLCEAQIDPKNAGNIDSEIKRTDANNISTNYLAANCLLVKPGLTGTPLVRSGTWEIEKKAGTAGRTASLVAFFNAASSGSGTKGLITDDMIVIEKARNTYGAVSRNRRWRLFKIKLPDGVKPDQAKGVVVKIKGLKLRGGNSFLGEQFGRNILAVYDGRFDEFAETLTHEVGHAVKQTPSKVNATGLEWANTPPPGLPDHPNYYYGSGIHCSYDCTSIDAGADKNDSDHDAKFNDGSCVMYHRGTSRCTGEFCVKCEPYLRAQDMSSLPVS